MSNVTIDISPVVREITIDVSRSKVPIGGLTGQALAKKTNNNYDVEWVTLSGSGDMLKSVYDPTNVNSDSFDMANMVEGINANILTDIERTAIGNNSAKNSYPSADETKLGTVETNAQVNTVTSVASKTGAVSLDTNDVSEGANLYYTEARVNANTNVAANTAKNSYPSGDATKVGHLTVTGAVDLDTINDDVSSNNAKTTSTPTVTANTLTVINLSNPAGNICNMASANSTTTYTTTGATAGGNAIVLINAASEPTITGATKIKGNDFIVSTDMHMVVQYLGVTVQYFFIEL